MMIKPRVTIEEASKTMSRDKYIRFFVLVPFVTSLSIQKQRQRKTGESSSLHEYYGRAINLINDAFAHEEWHDDTEAS